jgi:cysteine desulfurase/selenocysteine lyase
MEAYRRALRENVKLVSITATSNVTGQAPPVREVVREAAAQGGPVHLDAAQAFSSGWLDMTEDRPEFVTFSLHKAYGPSGLGGLYARREWLAKLEPTYCGAGTVDDHFGETSRYTAGAPRMEFGLQNYAAVYAVPAGMKVLAGIPPEATREHYAALNTALREQLRDLPQIRIVGPADPADAHHVCSFHVDGADALRVASLLDMAGNFQVRAGRLCAHHWFHQHEVPDVVRVSFGIHNSLQEVEDYGSVFRKILRHYL